jgi:CheY-like chemotaxis protein
MTVTCGRLFGPRFVKQGVQILVVDDEVAVRRSIKMMLEHVGHTVFQADCGEAALEQLGRLKFDLVITDFSMPGMQGDQLVARIRQMEPLQAIIMATAFAEAFKVFGKPEGSVDALILKPFTFKELLEVIADVLSRRAGGQPEVGPPNAGQTSSPAPPRALPE